MSLKIEFHEEAFDKLEESTTAFDKPEFRKFNMRFNNLDLLIIDAIAKRNGVSRSQIINDFIEETLKDFLRQCSSEEALLITEYAEFLSKNSTKSNRNFSWELWNISRSIVHPESLLENQMHVLNEGLKSGQAEQSLKNLKELLDRSKAKIQQG
ncbi:hypothetical protein [Psychrobacter sp. DM4]|uniref:hypothetical protein n=1 Tax=Psychrobacter sp. DM4 TaxID=3440637 RepID=UPI003F502EDF